MYTIEYRMGDTKAPLIPGHLGNFVILEDGKPTILVDPDHQFDPVDACKLAGKILIALEHWEKKP